MSEKNIEVVRAFSRKLNIGNYETLDFFASAKAEVNPVDKEKVSQELFDFVKKEVEDSIEEYKKGKNVNGQELWDSHQQSLYDKDSVLDGLNAEAGIAGELEK